MSMSKIICSKTKMLILSLLALPMCIFIFGLNKCTKILFRPRSRNEFRDMRKRFLISLIGIIITCVIPLSVSGVEPAKEIKTSSSQKIHQKDSEKGKSFSFSLDTDLKNVNNPLTKKEVYDILEHYTQEYHASLMRGKGDAFMEASKKSGYDVRFLIALCAVESGWDTSYEHRIRCNPYSIGMWDESYEMGSHFTSFDEGIVNGACIINDTFYKSGAKTLRQMQNMQLSDGTVVAYSATDGRWETTICDVVSMMQHYIKK